MKKLNEMHTKIEAILFLENAFLSKRELSHKASCNITDIQGYIDELNASYTQMEHSFRILAEDGNYLLAVKQDIATALSHLYKAKNQQKISRALLETLSVIAYSQPITKPEIDQLRGVNSDGAIKLLVGQNLIKNIGKKNVAGNPNQYGTTPEFLKTFGLKSIKDLPKMNEQDMKKFIETHKKDDVLEDDISPNITEEMVEEFEKNKALHDNKGIFQANDTSGSGDKKSSATTDNKSTRNSKNDQNNAQKNNQNNKKDK